MKAPSRFRWRFLAAWLSGFLGVALLLAGLARVGMMGYSYANFGLYPVRPDTPSLNLFALTMSNVAGAGFTLTVAMSLLVGCVASVRSLRRKHAQRAAGDDSTNVTA